MLAATTIVNTTHDPITAPVGLLDDFARDDGWPGDRPASCGNFWIDHFGPDYPLYISSGALQATPGLSLGFGSLYLGGAAQKFQADIDGGSNSNAWLLDFLTAATDTGISANRFRLEALSSGAYLTYLDGSGTETVLASYGTGFNSGLRTWYITATPVTGGTHIKVEWSLVGGSPTTLTDATFTQVLTGQHIAFGAFAGKKLDNLINLNPALSHSETFNAADNYPTGPIVTDGFTWAIGGGAGNYGRSSNALFFDGHDSDAFNTAAVVTLECGSGDGTVTVTGARNTSSTYGTGLAWRQSAPGTFWFIETSASSTHGQGAVRRAVSGHTTGTTYLTIGTLPDNATLSVSLAGPLMTFYVNGTNVGTVTDSTDATASKHGVASDRGGGFGSADSFTFA